MDWEWQEEAFQVGEIGHTAWAGFGIRNINTISSNNTSINDSNRRHLYRPYCSSDTVLNILHIFTHLILTATLCTMKIIIIPIP